MADDLNTQLVFGANTAGAEAGVRTVKRSLKDLADSAAAAGKSIEGAGDKAGQSLSGIADGGEAAARKIQRDPLLEAVGIEAKTPTLNKLRCGMWTVNDRYR